MPTINISVSGIPRVSAFPWRVDALSYTENAETPPQETFHRGTLGVCIRLYSGQEFAYDTIRGIDYTNRFPNVVFKMPGVSHKFGYSETRRTFEIQYREAVMYELMKVLPFPDVPIWEADLSDAESRTIRELMRLMEHSMESGTADRIDVLSFELTESLLLNRKSEEPDWYRTRIMSIVSYFKVHFADGFDLDGLLRSHGMSRSTFVRHWRDFFPVTPGEYILQLKLEEACRMLLEMPHYSVSEISSRLNFSEPNYFCALFRKRFGTTPLRYRRRGGTSAPRPSA